MHRPTDPNRRPITVLTALLSSFALASAALAQTAEPAAIPPPSLAPSLAQRLAAIDTASLDPEARAKVDASLARWMALPPPLAGRWLLINIPAYEISLYDGPTRAGTWRAIVGKPKTPTPRFSGTVNGVILNPWWEVPASIVAESVGRLVARNPKKAAQEGYVRDGDRYRQRPGPRNQLGLMKLDFRNPYSVGIHDTPSRQLFEKEKRAFSHGCIRVDDPFGFAAALLGPPASGDSLKTVGEQDPDTRHLPLAEPLPVIIGYFTAEVADDGTLRLFDDVYTLDRGANATASATGPGDDCAR
jgi:L,D-transpeptidase YcbB